MTRKKDLSEREHVGTSFTQAGDDEPRAIDVYYLPPSFPVNKKLREICSKHLSEGRASELVGDFDLGAVVFPDASEVQEMTTQISCRGVSCILKKCGLTITQFSPDGDTLSQTRSV